MKGKLLIVEDEQDLLKLLQITFEKHGYRVFPAREPASGLALARQMKPDLILLDIMLPQMDGLEFCRIIRQETKAPILFLTAKVSEVDRILGLKIGGDDYITKPFSMGELVARVEAHLRRAALAAHPEDGAVGDAEGIAIDLEKREVRVRGKAKNLTPREFDLLKLLLDAEGKILSREAILEKLWGAERMADINARTVDQHVARLRRKLKPEGGRIMTVTKSGYRVRR
ncbi:MAG TPA: DNA-binding response regulator [Elusimicrobia bacterium]|nr:DNA-binding response regulator [Elusimicrobiota bacterium]